jgi:DNA integrity scanning protein DisA with diadenylate cyclase activity
MVGLHDDPPSAPTELQMQLLHAAASIGRLPLTRRVLYMGDVPFPAELIDATLREKLVHVVSRAPLRDALLQRAERAVCVPGYAMGRQDKLKLALIGATTRGYVQQGDRVIGLVGPGPQAYPDTLLVTELDQTAREATVFGEIGGGRVDPAVFEAIVELALELGIEGWEGHALGAMFVIGDVERVMAGSRQLTINPFRGYSDAERDLADPAVREALRGFSTLDGAFVVREDGVVVAAARYLEFPARTDIQIPLGLGSRHVAAALVTAATDAIAVVVSQATGSVRVFRRGAAVLELPPGHRRI